MVAARWMAYRWRSVVAVLVALGVVASVTAGAVGQESAPSRGEALADQTVQIHTTATIDVADAFEGTVTSYAVRSTETSSVTVSVDGSVVSYTGVARGAAFVTVTASNAAGSASQRFFVEVTVPPPPFVRRAAPILSLPQGALVALKVLDHFGATVDSYAASSGDVTKMTVSLDHNIAVVRAAAVGSATLTLSATNVGGTTTTSNTITVTAAELLPAPPTRTTTAPTAQRLSAGRSRTVAMADLFNEATPTHWLAAPADPTVVTATATANGDTVLTGVAAGTTTVRVVAHNHGGLATADIAVTVVEATPPAITATAPSHCLTGEGTPTRIGSNTGREGIATIDIAYTITGGLEPFTITNDANNISTTDQTGTINITCARPGINIFNVDPTANAVESGPKTITLTVTDANGDTATTQITTQIVEDAVTTEYNGGTMQAGKTYVIGDTDQWTLLTLPQDLNLTFAGLADNGSAHGVARFVDPSSGSEIWLDWGTGQERYRTIPTISSTTRDAEDQGTRTPSMSDLFDSLIASRSSPDGIAYLGGGGHAGNRWRPYRGLPHNTHVAVHPLLLEGISVPVCVVATEADFGRTVSTDEPARTQAQHHARFLSSTSDAVEAWNTIIHQPNSSTEGTEHRPFTLDCNTTASGVNQSNYTIYVRKVYEPASVCDATYGCAFRWITGRRPPMISHASSGGDTRTFYIAVTTENSDDFPWVIAHELGHFAGLGDYRYNLPDDPTPCASSEQSLYSYPGEECHATTITTRDANDVHEIYHPDSLNELRVVHDGRVVTRPGSDASVEDGGWELHAELPQDSGRMIAAGGLGSVTAYEHEYNAYGYVVWSRDLRLQGEWELLGGVPLSEIVVADDQIQINFQRDLGRPESFSPSGREYLVAGVTRGDRKRNSAASVPVASRHSTVRTAIGTLDRSWTVGEPESTWLPPSTPSIVYVHGKDQTARVFWYPVALANDYEVSWDTGPGTPRESRRLGTSQTFVDIGNLTNGARYYFRVKAFIGRAESELSTAWSATPALVARPTLVTWTAASEFSGRLTWTGPSGVNRFEVRSQHATNTGGDQEARSTATTPVEVLVAVSGEEHSFTELVPGSTYVFAVRSVLEATVGGSVETTVSAWSETVSVTTPMPSLPAPTGLTVTEGDNRLTWSWDAVAGASAYDYMWSGADLSLSGQTSARRLGLVGISVGREYVFSVRAVNTTTSATSPWATVRITPDGNAGVVTPPPPPPTTSSTTSSTTSTTLPPPLPPSSSVTLQGKVGVMRMPPTPVGGHTLSLAYYTSGGTRVLPRLRFLPFEDLATTWQYTSDVELTVNGLDTNVGRVAYRKTTATGDRIELGFLPNGASTVIKPTVRHKSYSDMVNYTWYVSSTFSYTATPGARARSDAVARFAGLLASDAAPGDHVCEGCYTTTADLEP